MSASNPIRTAPPLDGNSPFNLTLGLRRAKPKTRIAAIWLALSSGLLTAADSPSIDPAYQIVERGQDFALYQKVIATTNAAGQALRCTNQFTLLENSLN